MSETKFNFDVHNQISFLPNGEKLYAIFFSEKIIAVSLITNIIDSFRRPGNLVVTAYMPRRHYIANRSNPRAKDAVYRLLNEVNDKFYERNFLNGMVNQNPAVLMQDYYSDILSGYSLEPDLSQKDVNVRINLNVPSKLSGYISADERSVAKYLASVCRKSYEGYHQIFFASNAPANINEEPEEVITYKVKITNDGRQLPGEVRLTDRIPTVTPKQGEIPLAKTDYTYGQILNGDAGNDITASIQDGTIILSFKFQKEEKTLCFKFYDGNEEVRYQDIRPVIKIGDGFMPLSSGSFTFRGKEIYGAMTLESRNSVYTIDSRSANFDPSRYKDGDTIDMPVSKGWMWNFNPVNTKTGEPAKFLPVDIRLYNKNTKDNLYFKNVTNSFSETIPGKETDWHMYITSDYYLPTDDRPNGTNYTFKDKPAQQSQTVNQTAYQRSRVTGVNEAVAQRSNAGTTVRGNSSNSLHITGTGNEGAKEPSDSNPDVKSKYIKLGLLAVAGVLVCVIGVWVYSVIFKEKKDDPDPKKPVVTASNATKDVTFKIVDCDGKELDDVMRQKLTVSVIPSDNASVQKNEDGKSYSMVYELNAEEPQTITVEVTYRDVNLIQKDSEKFEIESMGDVVDIRLSVKEFDINLYEVVERGIDKTQYDKCNQWIEEIKNKRNFDYGNILADMLPKPKEANNPEVKTQKENSNKNLQEKKVSKKEEIPEELNQTTLYMAQLRSLLNKYKGNSEAESRINALISALGNIENGDAPSSSKNLGKEQEEIVKNLIGIKKDIDGLPEESDAQKKRKKDLQQEYSNTLQTTDKKGKISLNTASNAKNMQGRINSAKKAK